MSTDRRASGSMEPIAESIEALGWALRALGERPAASGSRVHLSHVDYTLTGAWARRPLLESYSLARMNTAHAADHLLGIAACIRAEGVIFAVITLHRALLESAAQAFYLWAEDIDTRERVRRWANLSLDAEMETLRLVLGPHADADDQAMVKDQRLKIDRILDSARKHGFEVDDQNLDKKLAKNPVHASTPYVGVRPPRVMSLVDDVLAAVGTGVGGTTYRLASAVAHAQAHGHKAFWMKDEKMVSNLPGVSTVPIGITGQNLITWLMPSVLAAHVLTLRVIAANGWSDTVWQSTALPILQKWSGSLRSVS